MLMVWVYNRDLGGASISSGGHSDTTDVVDIGIPYVSCIVAYLEPCNTSVLMSSVCRR